MALEVQLQMQQDSAKQAAESKRQRDSDRVLSLERQVSVCCNRLVDAGWMLIILLDYCEACEHWLSVLQHLNFQGFSSCNSLRVCG